MDIVIQSNLKTLTRCKYLLDNLTDEFLCNASVPPYYSSIGSHIRHVLDFYDCIFNLNFDNEVDLTSRSRNRKIESECVSAKKYLDSIIDKFIKFEFDMNTSVSVLDDLGLGKVKMTYTYGALFSQANSHTIHHYAIINYVLESLNISINDSCFGYNSTTPKEAPSR